MDARISNTYLEEIYDNSKILVFTVFIVSISDTGKGIICDIVLNI